MYESEEREGAEAAPSDYPVDEGKLLVRIFARTEPGKESTSVSAPHVEACGGRQETIRQGESSAGDHAKKCAGENDESSRWHTQHLAPDISCSEAEGGRRSHAFYCSTKAGKETFQADAAAPKLHQLLVTAANAARGSSR